MKKSFLLALCCVSILAGCGFYHPITGTVIDAETRQPIEGAMVMVEWTRQVGFGEYHTKSVKVFEGVTDKNGKVSIEGIFNLSVDSPDVVVYKPGYVAWSSRSIFPSHKNREDFSWGNYTFQLERFKPEYSYVEHDGFFSGAINSTLNSNKMIEKVFDDWERWNVIQENYRKHPLKEVR